MAKERFWLREEADLVLAARGVMQPASIAGDLVIGQQQEAHVHALNDDPEPCHSRPNAHSHEAVLCSEATEQSDMHVSQMGFACAAVQAPDAGCAGQCI